MNVTRSSIQTMNVLIIADYFINMHRLPRHNVIRVFEGFAGYGGATFGLRRSRVRHRVIGNSEVDEDAIELYHPKIRRYFSSV